VPEEHDTWCYCELAYCRGAEKCRVRSRAYYLYLSVQQGTVGGDSCPNHWVQIKNNLQEYTFVVAVVWLCCCIRSGVGAGVGAGVGVHLVLVALVVLVRVLGVGVEVSGYHVVHSLVNIFVDFGGFGYLLGFYVVIYVRRYLQNLSQGALRL